jgi:UDP-glucose 4-epimerase
VTDATARGQRVLVTAAASRIGGLVVAALEADPRIETVIAVDAQAPAAPFGRAEFVRLREHYAQLARVASGAAVDVVVDARAAAALAPPDHGAVVALAAGSDRILEVCADPDGGIRRLVVLSSAHRYGWDGLPRFVTEQTPLASRKGGSPLLHALCDLEARAEAAAAAREGLRLTVLRTADPVGPAGAGLVQALDLLPLFPTVLGFDPAVQVVHEDDLAGAAAHAVVGGLDGEYLVAADGTLALTEALRALGVNHAPVLPPWGTGLLSRLLRRTGLRFTEDVAGMLRHGRGIDNRKLKATGFAYRATTREALATVVPGRHRRLALGTGGGSSETAYDPDVEAFLRYSPSARRPEAPVDGEQRRGIAALDAEALLALLPSLDGAALRALRAHEHAGPRRERLIAEIDLVLAER